jgi:V/A-type H+-transporting ATPase subunit I
MALVSLFAFKKFHFDQDKQKFFKLMLYCGISTTFWGALFGSWFGSEFLSKYVIWFNPVEDPEELLRWSLLFGVIHVYVGLAVRGANLFRSKKYIDIFFDVFLWYIFFTGFVLFVLPYIPKSEPEKLGDLVQLGKYLLMIGGIMIVLTQGRKQKNIFMKLISGVGSLYELISFMSDVLSYSRLLALGLATSVIASIINQVCQMAGLDTAIKVIIFIVVATVGHIFNFAINALGAYVHSSRLQYIEFFGKFYEGGGVAFDPLKINTKYIKLKIGGN